MSKMVQITPKIVNFKILQSPTLKELASIIQGAIEIEEAGYVLKGNPFNVFHGKTLQFVRAPGSSDETMDRSIDDLDLSLRARRCLRNENVQTIGQLVKKTRAELFASKNFNRRSLDEIILALSLMGLFLS